MLHSQCREWAAHSIDEEGRVVCIEGAIHAVEARNGVVFSEAGVKESSAVSPLKNCEGCRWVSAVGDEGVEMTKCGDRSGGDAWRTQSSENDRPFDAEFD